MVWLALLALIVPWLVIQTPREIGRWQLAGAFHARDAGQTERAYALLADAMEWFPDQPALLFQRATWRLEDGQETEALADCDRAVELAGDSYQALELRSQFLQYAGRQADALKDLKTVEAISQRHGVPSRAHALNSLAYGRALAQKELDEALQQATQAINLTPANDPSRLAILDTHGYILYLKGNYAAALSEMDLAVAGMEQFVLIEQKRNEQASIPPKHKRLFDLGVGIPGGSSLRRSTAVIRYHRALVLLALGREKDAEADLARVRQLIGKEPDETLF
jgi:tetratricopeptide (TPR) repeat protein